MPVMPGAPVADPASGCGHRGTGGGDRPGGICASCVAHDDRCLIAAAYAALQPLAPSLRPLGPGGSA